MGYKVTWEIYFEDEVNSPEEAAKLALDYIVNGTARVFNVETLDTGGKRMVVPTVTVDVDALEDQECEEDTSELATLTAKQRQLNRALVILGQGDIKDALSILNNMPVTVNTTNSPITMVTTETIDVSEVGKEGPCSLCGEPGVYTFDPYAHDIRGVLEYDYYCEACLHNMAQDI